MGEETLNSIFPVGIIFAMIGGLIGALWASEKVEDGFLLSLLNVLIGMGFSAGLAEYLMPLDAVWACFSIGIIAGTLSGYFIEFINKSGFEIVKTIFYAVLEKILDTRKKDE